MLEFQKVTKTYGTGTKALDEFTFSVGDGEFVLLRGASGAGKTTLLKLMLKEVEPTSGQILIDGDDLSRIPRKKIHLLRRKVGAVFQDFKVLMDRTVGENIALALDILNLKPSVISDRLKELLRLTGLEGKEDVFPSQLSGGELQRVAIARAVAPQPKIIFADEPTGNLDEETGWHIVQLLQDINAQGTMVLMATHNKNILHNLGSRVIEIQKGKLVKDTGTKEKKKEPENQEEKQHEQ